MQRTEQSTTAKVWVATKRYALPTALVIGQVAGPTGSAVFATSRFMHFMTGVDNSPYHTPAIAIAGSSTAFMTLVTRVVASYLHNHPKNSDQPHAEQAVPLKFQYQSLSILLQLIVYISTAFSGLGGYLGGVSIIEETSKKNDNEIYYTNKLIAGLVIAAALYIAACGIYASMALPLKSARKNIRAFALNLQERTLSFNRYTLFTFGIAIPGIACQPFQGYFSTSNAVMKIPYVQVSPIVAYTLGGISAFTLVSNLIATQVPAVYDRFKNKRVPINPERKYCLDTPLSIAVKAIGLVHAIVTGVNTFTAITSSMHDIFDVDQRHPYLLTFAISASLSLAVMQYIFGALQNFERVKSDFYIATQENVYMQIPAGISDDLEAGYNGLIAIENQPSPSISTSQFSLLATPQILSLAADPAFEISSARLT